MTREGSSLDSEFSFSVLRSLRRNERGARINDAGVGGTFLVFALATLAQAGANAALAASAGLMGQALLKGQGVAPSRIVDLPISFSPVTLCLVGLAAAVVKTGGGGVATYAQKTLAFRAADGIRCDVAEAILGGVPRADLAAPAEAHARAAVQLREVERAVDEGLLAAVRSVATLVPLALTLILMSRWLAIGALGSLAVFGLALSRSRSGLRRSHARAVTLAERLHRDLDELVRHLELWRTFGAQGHAREALARSSIAAGEAAARSDAVKSIASGANEVAAALALLVTILAVTRGLLPLGEGPLVAFATVFFMMYRPLRDLAEARAWIERGRGCMRALNDFGGGASEALVGSSPIDTAEVRAWPSATLAVRAVAVTRAARVLAPVSFEAAPGELIAVMGPTGSGKTSLLRGLLGLAPVPAGEVRYGDELLTTAGVGPAHRPFAWVPQEPAIVAGTLAVNIALGSNLDAAAAALRAIGARSLEGRLSDRLSAGGPELSGGERQWVAIARALATGLPVLLLDEPTAGLDAASQGRVLAALAALKGQRTVVLVTHRPEPLALADRVIDLGHR